MESAMTDMLENVMLLVALMASGVAGIVVLVIMLIKFADYMENIND
jgi:hypothetical protein